MFQRKFVEKLQTRILCSINFVRISFHLWDNVEKYRTPGQAADANIILSVRLACRINKATNTYSEYVMPIVMQTHVSVCVYTNIAGLFIYPCWSCNWPLGC
jgi:hypothetical protein